MADPQEILSDPNFQAMPLGERLKVMRQVDPNFAALSPMDQGTVIYKAAQGYLQTPTGEAGPPDEGFLSTLGSDIFHLPVSLLRMANPVTASQDVVRGMREMGSKAVNELRQRNPLGAMGYGTAAAVPFFGPAAAQAGEELGAGQYGQAGAHALELLAPYIREGAPPVGRAVRGAYRGAANAPKPSLPMTFVGEQLGQALGHPITGTVVGAGLPKIIPAIKGFFNGLTESPPKPSLPPLPDYTMGGNELSIPGIGPRPPQPAPMPPPPAGLTGVEGIQRGPFPDVGPIAVRGTPEIPAPRPGTPTAAATGTPEPTPAASAYDDVAKAYMGKKYSKLTPEDQMSVNNIVNNLKPAGAPAYPTESPVTVQGVIPEGEHNIIRKVAETNRGNKDVTIARSLKDENITLEGLDKMSDADLKSRVTALGYKPSYGKNYSRTWEAFRRDLRQLMDKPGPPTSQPMPPK